MSSPTPNKRRRPTRVSAACDLCKSRKVKCDGTQPCAYCAKRSQPCTFSASRTTTRPGPSAASASDSVRDAVPTAAGNIVAVAASALPEPRDDCPHVIADSPSLPSPSTTRRTEANDDADTAVPREAQLHRDPQGTAIFVGDCAPLSFLQTVRHLIASETDAGGMMDQIARASVVEVAAGREGGADGEYSFSVRASDVEGLVRGYFLASGGLMELFDREALAPLISAWALGRAQTTDASTAATYFLVLAIGAQEEEERRAERWFAHARDELTANMCGCMNVATVQGFALVALYMLRAFQANGAYLYFSLAARTAYAIGLHRTEVNASFGAPMHRERDRVWKSLRVMDMVVSNLLGRPPSTSDVDCTVKYHASDLVLNDSPGITAHMIDASVQIFMVFERIVVEVYSRKRISLHIANYVSRQLKSWASKWLKPLTAVLGSASASTVKNDRIAACRIICSYYNCIMLLTRPFLIFDIYAHLGAPLRASTTHADDQVKKEFADAAIDAAISCIESLHQVINSNSMPLRMPVVVSWLFMTSLVLTIGVMGRNGLSLEPHCRASLQCLSYFSNVDPHARQYVQIIQSLLRVVVKHVQSKELRQRNERRRASSKLFGLHLSTSEDISLSRMPSTSGNADAFAAVNGAAYPRADESITADWTIYDAEFFAMPGVNENDLALQDFLQPGRQTAEGALADIPLFPMYDQMESIMTRTEP